MGKKLVKRKIKLISKNLKPLYWVNSDTGERFVGKAKGEDGGWYWYGSKGHKTKLDEVTSKEFLPELWQNENPKNAGLEGKLYKPYFLYNSKGDTVLYNRNTAPRPDLVGKPLENVGPGLDIYHMLIEDQARKGLTREKVDSIALLLIDNNMNKVNEYLSWYTERPDTISPLIKKGLLDLRYQTGNLGLWDDLGKAIIDGNISKIREEAEVKSTPSRNSKRNKNNWWYYELDN